MPCEAQAQHMRALPDDLQTRLQELAQNPLRIYRLAQVIWEDSRGRANMIPPLPQGVIYELIPGVRGPRRESFLCARSVDGNDGFALFDALGFVSLVFGHPFSLQASPALVAATKPMLSRLEGSWPISNSSWKVKT